MYLVFFCYIFDMKEFINGKIWNTDSSVMVKYLVEEEELGDGYIRYVQKALMQRPREMDYFVWVTKITTDRRNTLLDKNEYVYPVEESYVKRFGKGMPDIFP